MLVDIFDFKRTVLWAAQDLDLAVRFFRVHADELKINPQKIFVLGNSSGAIVALHNIYGKFEYQADAVVSLWGAVLDLNAVGKSETPVLLVHGLDDAVIPFKQGVMKSLDSLTKDVNFLGYRNILSSF